MFFGRPRQRAAGLINVVSQILVQRGGKSLVADQGIIIQRVVSYQNIFLYRKTDIGIVLVQRQQKLAVFVCQAEYQIIAGALQAF